jgi:hypothetical protein
MNLLRINNVLILSLFLAVRPALSQTVPITQHGNQVQCGNVVALGGGKVNLTCQGLTSEQMKLLKTTIPGMLEKLLDADAQQFATIEAQLNELKATTQGGNLKERALDLANDMVMDMVRRGYQPPGGHIDLPNGEKPHLHLPTPADTKDYQDTWWRNMRHSFRFHFGQRLIEIHDEFAQLHLRDRDLDDWVKEYQYDGNRPDSIMPVNAFEVQRLADSLTALANRLGSGQTHRDVGPTQQ